MATTPDISSSSAPPGWLLFFYTVPSRPVGNRMRIWRNLAKIGATPLKGAVYLLPDSDEHQELLKWLVAEVSSLGGEAGFVCAAEVFPLATGELHQLFDTQRVKEYSAVRKELDAFARRFAAVRKGSRPPRGNTLLKQFRKIKTSFATVRKIDFFHCAEGDALAQQLSRWERELAALARGKTEDQDQIGGLPIRRQDFQQRTWVTRPRPFVDRIASAWLIKRFIDPKARFVFLPEEKLATAKGDMLSYDVAGGDFSHVNDMCTFESLIARFDLHDPALKRLAHIVHDIDLKDDKYGDPAAAGIEAVITGIRSQDVPDEEMLTRGMGIFDALYATERR